MNKEMVRLAGGETVEVEVNGKSLDGLRGHAFLLATNREIDVVKIDGAWYEETFHAGTNYEPLPDGKTRVTTYAEGGQILNNELVSTEEAMRQLEATIKQHEPSAFEEIHGPSYPHAKYQIGATIRFPDSSSPTGINSGRVLHVIAPAEGRSCAYVVTPAITAFPIEVFANEIIEA